MRADKLSMRLERVANYIKKDGILADIGSDHAYLPCYAVGNKQVSIAIAGEVVKGPFNSACRTVADLGLTKNIEVRLGNGLAVLKRGEADTVTICGMGGSLITQILEEGKAVLVGKERLILQPNINSESVRRWLVEYGWTIIAEEIIEEDNKIYEILVSEHGQNHPIHLSEADVVLGPFLSKEKNPVFIKKWKKEIVHLERVLSGIETAQQNDKNLERKEELLTLISIIKANIKC